MRPCGQGCLEAQTRVGEPSRHGLIDALPLALASRSLGGDAVFVPPLQPVCGRPAQGDAVSHILAPRLRMVTLFATGPTGQQTLGTPRKAPEAPAAGPRRLSCLACLRVRSPIGTVVTLSLSAPPASPGPRASSMTPSQPSLRKSTARYNPLSAHSSTVNPDARVRLAQGRLHPGQCSRAVFRLSHLRAFTRPAIRARRPAPSPPLGEPGTKRHARPGAVATGRRFLCRKRLQLRAAQHLPHRGASPAWAWAGSVPALVGRGVQGAGPLGTPNRAPGGLVGIY